MGAMLAKEHEAVVIAAREEERAVAEQELAVVKTRLEEAQREIKRQTEIARREATAAAQEKERRIATVARLAEAHEAVAATLKQECAADAASLARAREVADASLEQQHAAENTSLSVALEQDQSVSTVTSAISVTS